MRTYADFIQAWLLPPGLQIFFLIISLVLYHIKIWSKIFIWLALLSLYLLSLMPVALFLINPLQYYYPLLNNFTPKENAAIVVLGGGVNFAPEYQSIIGSNATQARTKYAAMLWQKLHVPVIVSGFGLEAGAHESEVMAKELALYNVEPIILENQGKTTITQAQYLLPIIQQQHFKNIYLVTDAYHMPRSLLSLKQQVKNDAINFIPAPMGLFSNEYNKGIFYNFIPSMSSLNISSIALHEYLGWCAYKILCSGKSIC